MDKLAGKHVVITGASAGIGAELARQLAARGCRLTLAARRLDRLEQIGANCSGSSQIRCVQCDVTDEAQLTALVEHARADVEIDIWINNAGSGVRHRLLNATAEDMLALYRLHVLAPLRAYQLIAPRWIAAGHAGQFVDICSVGGKVGYPYNVGYVAAKHALSGLGDVARLELYRHRISVTTAYPGVTVSDFSAASLDRTGGASGQFVNETRARGSLLRRLVAKPQPTAGAVRRIIRGIERRDPLVFPHFWGAVALALYHLAPRYVSSRVGSALNG